MILLPCNNDFVQNGRVLDRSVLLHPQVFIFIRFTIFVENLREKKRVTKKKEHHLIPPLVVVSNRILIN